MSATKILQKNSHLMKESLRILQDDLSKIDGGKVNIALLSDIVVQRGGSRFKLSQISRIAVFDFKTATVEPWDKDFVSLIEKAILSSNLGLGCFNAGGSLRIIFPQMTEEKKLKIIKFIKTRGESSKISLRTIRRESNSSLKELSKANSISLDDLRFYQKKIQKETDLMIARSENVILETERQILR